ncbi:helix-turn-helix domain-containing protein [Pedobacter sp. MW01-1-1]|uniref:helix-turn-helix domain-containing protein n=1 Tax=Pedobacter sp. MW01-1-1 TaxID=3383027 RepID=UPI003FEF64C3
MKIKNIHPNIGANIRKLRELRNYTQQYVANELGLSIVQYGKLEHNETINTKYLFGIADILQTSVGSILSFDSESYFENSWKHVDNSSKLEFLNSATTKDTDAQEVLIKLMQKILEKLG